jgi:delta 1-pyrroline-5-carboxylate dehydrogenase
LRPSASRGGKFLSAGQACVAPDYALVHQSRVAEFVAAAKQTVATFYGATEDARAKSHDISRVIDARSVERLGALIEDAVRRGATVECGGRWDSSTRYVAPTILSGVGMDAEIMQDEIFGPVLPVLTYANTDELYRIIRSRGKPLAMYIFSRSRSKIEDALRNTSAGGSVVNNTLIHLANPNLPFGGVGGAGSAAITASSAFRRSRTLERWSDRDPSPSRGCSIHRMARIPIDWSNGSTVSARRSEPRHRCSTEVDQESQLWRRRSSRVDQVSSVATSFEPCDRGATTSARWRAATRRLLE